MRIRMFVKENTWLSSLDVGWGNGYVIIPKGHPLHGKGYDDIDVSVHGGLTFSGPVNELDNSKEGGWFEIKPKDKDGWVIGFDTAHYGDNKMNWSKERVLKETQLLKEQVEKLS